MPSFDNTWLSSNNNNNVSFPAITPFATPDAGFQPDDDLSSEEKSCGFCGVRFAATDGEATSSCCDDLSCPECTWLWRNREGVCWDCVKRFVCKAMKKEEEEKGEGGVVEVDGLEGGGDEGGYDGDDEGEGV